MAPKVSIVICTRDRPRDLDKCLASVARLDYRDFDVLVVDNAPSDQRAAEVCRRWQTRYVVESAPGLSKARNRGARECKGEIVAYIDDDATAEPAWLSALVPEFDDPRVMAVTGGILPLQNHPAGPAGNDMAAANDSPSRRVVDSDTPGWFEMANFGGLGIGANMSIRRSAFDVWPGFDERLGRGAALFAGEDDYAFFRLIELGYRVVFCSSACVRHRRLDEDYEGRDCQASLLAGSVGYAIFLHQQAPRYRRVILKYFLGGLGGRARPWHGESATVRPAVRRPLSLAGAVARGFIIYGRSRLRAG